MATLNTDLLRHLMQQKGVDDYATLCRLAGVSRVTVWKARKGEPLRSQTLRKIERALIDAEPINSSGLIRP